MNEMILEAKDLHFRYDPDGSAWALDGVTTRVRRGEFVAVLGANGCGKSTLAKHFNAILLPEQGAVTVEGMDTADDDKLYDIRQKVGMVFQNPDNQIVATFLAVLELCRLKSVELEDDDRELNVRFVKMPDGTGEDSQDGTE